MAQLNGSTVAILRYWWDSQCPENTGWYVEALDADGNFLDDSMKMFGMSLPCKKRKHSSKVIRGERSYIMSVYSLSPRRKYYPC